MCRWRSFNERAWRDLTIWRTRLCFAARSFCSQVQCLARSRALLCCRLRWPEGQRFPLKFVQDLPIGLSCFPHIHNSLLIRGSDGPSPARKANPCPVCGCCLVLSLFAFLAAAVESVVETVAEAILRTSRRSLRTTAFLEP